ncbi:MAG: class II fructose-bisphosphatase [Rhodospirillales bacterium]|jgi:fructose-1,6-bisphosphatase II / sedoheptulose-1,7-bisphosphatase|nr:class II fructose-bisphosphatase [Rhodospirillales bacterium]
MNKETVASRNLAMDAVRVTEATALAASRFLGRGDEQAADQAAVDAMHSALKGMAIEGVIRIGEGTRENAEKLYSGESGGTGNGPVVDLALMPLEGPTIVAKGEPNGLSVIAIAEAGQFADLPPIYMDKIAVGGGLPDGVINLDDEPGNNLREMAKAKGVDIGDLVACILDRPRHRELIAKTREAGARILLIGDGDLSGVVSTAWPETGIDIYMGSGGAREGILSAAALACVGGQMQGRLIFRNDDERHKAASCGIEDFNRVYSVADMASGEVTFAATGVTHGAMLMGVKRRHGAAMTHSLVMRSLTGTLHFIEAYHDFANWSGATPRLRPKA